MASGYFIIHPLAKAIEVAVTHEHEEVLVQVACPSCHARVKLQADLQPLFMPQPAFTRDVKMNNFSNPTNGSSFREEGGTPSLSRHRSAPQSLMSLRHAKTLLKFC